MRAAVREAYESGKTAEDIKPESWVRRPWRWNKNKKWAAQLLAAGDLGRPQIAEKIGLSYSSLAKWSRMPEFQAEISRQADEFARQILGRSAALKLKRIENQVDIVDRLKQVVNERSQAAELDLTAEPGARTGIVRSDGSIDGVLITKLNETQKAIAIELGQWDESSGVSNHGVNINLVSISQASNGPVIDIQVDKPDILTNLVRNRGAEILTK